mmetsp:Transcript_15480/g.42780  ORF Transcript_15480/g.42780 Transcript_15480/m.42780 type:complete len:203 (+) Transcript_15480:212-820(+)
MCTFAKLACQFYSRLPDSLQGAGVVHLSTREHTRVHDSTLHRVLYLSLSRERYRSTRALSDSFQQPALVSFHHFTSHGHDGQNSGDDHGVVPLPCRFLHQPLLVHQTPNSQTASQKALRTVNLLLVGGHGRQHGILSRIVVRGVGGHGRHPEQTQGFVHILDTHLGVQPHLGQALRYAHQRLQLAHRDGDDRLLRSTVCAIR